MDSQSFDEPPMVENVADVTEPAPRRRGSIWLAWAAIMATIAFAVLPHFMGGEEDSGESSIIMLEIQAKYVVGAATLSLIPKDACEGQIATAFGNGPLRQRLMGAVLLGELIGPERAMKSLDDLQTQIDKSSIVAKAPDIEVLRLLQKMQQSRIDQQEIESDLSDDERQSCRVLLPQRLGWAGRLALAPPGTANQADRTTLLNQARRILFVVFGVFGLACLALFCGVVLQIAWWIFVVMGRVHSGIGEIRGNHVIYAETFAVWMTLYLGLSYLISLSALSKLGLGMALVVQIGSLAALAWPLIRGLSWSDVCEDVGLRLGPQSWTVPFIGVGTYLSALPMVGAAMVVTLVMMAIASQLSGANEQVASPMHPIVEPILRGNWTIRLQLLLVAVFAAIPEEIMFRGVLYRHLREAGKKFGYVGSVAFAALISSFVFAAIHPQGLFGIPILMTLAIVFALAREWRGTLAPSMIAHAMVNAGTTTVLFLMAD